jgi:F-type H+-transporting ATPase subunit delta
MTEKATLARPYAEAVFKIAKASDTAEKWSEMLAFIAVVVQDSDIAGAAENPKIEQQKFVDLLLNICADQVNDHGVNFLRLLVENHRLSLVPQMTELYEQYRAEDEGYIDVTVNSAFALSKAEQKKLAKALEKKLNKQVHIDVAIDKSLIGGIFVRAGDQVIDASIKGRLQQLAKQL